MQTIEERRKHETFSRRIFSRRGGERSGADPTIHLESCPLGCSLGSALLVDAQPCCPVSGLRTVQLHQLLQTLHVLVGGG